MKTIHIITGISLLFGLMITACEIEDDDDDPRLPPNGNCSRAQDCSAVQQCNLETSQCVEPFNFDPVPQNFTISANFDCDATGRSSLNNDREYIIGANNNSFAGLSIGCDVIESTSIPGRSILSIRLRSLSIGTFFSPSEGIVNREVSADNPMLLVRTSAPEGQGTIAVGQSGTFRIDSVANNRIRGAINVRFVPFVDNPQPPTPPANPCGGSPTSCDPPNICDNGSGTEVCRATCSQTDHSSCANDEACQSPADNTDNICITYGCLNQTCPIGQGCNDTNLYIPQCVPASNFTGQIDVPISSNASLGTVNVTGTNTPVGNWTSTSVSARVTTLSEDNSEVILVTITGTANTELRLFLFSQSLRAGKSRLFHRADFRAFLNAGDTILASGFIGSGIININNLATTAGGRLSFDLSIDITPQSDTNSSVEGTCIFSTLCYSSEDATDCGIGTFSTQTCIERGFTTQCCQTFSVDNTTARTFFQNETCAEASQRLDINYIDCPTSLPVSLVGTCEFNENICSETVFAPDCNGTFTLTESCPSRGFPTPCCLGTPADSVVVENVRYRDFVPDASCTEANDRLGLSFYQECP